MNTPAPHPEDELAVLLKQCLALAYSSKDFELHQRIGKMLQHVEQALRYHNGGPVVAVLDH